MPSDVECQSCRGSVPASDWAAHQRRFHLSSQHHRFFCFHCHYYGPEFPDYLPHCLLEGHLNGVEGDASQGLVVNVNGVSQRQEREEHVKGCVDRKHVVLNQATELEQVNGVLQKIKRKERIEYADERQLVVRTANDGPKKQQNETTSSELANSPHSPMCRSTHLSSVESESPLASKDSTSNPKTIVSASDTEPTDGYSYKSIHTNSANTDALNDSWLFPSINQPSINPVNQRHLTCTKCQASIKYGKTNFRLKSAVAHTLFCFRLKPFKCSGCDFASSRRVELGRHRSSRSRCKGARIELVNQEETEKAVRAGLLKCFPEHNFAFAGFHENGSQITFFY